MLPFNRYKRALCLLLALLMPLALCACAADDGAAPDQPQPQEPDTSRYLVAIEDEPDTVDFQCTTIHYTVAQNVFDRLVEMKTNTHGSVVPTASLARWEISRDGRVYTFHLRDGVRFSNGAALTSADVEYTLTRLLTHPNGCNRDIAESILGASALERGESGALEGFRSLSDLDFEITLAEPFAAFLACLSMPGASILDMETTEAAGERFGLDPAWTIGTGSFILERWEPGVGMLLRANGDCWKGAPKCDGLDLRFLSETEDIRELFETGALDILDLDEVGSAVEYYMRGDIYQSRLHSVQPVGISYIALNASKAPLDDARVRKALQLGVNRATLLDVVYSGRGAVENGIFPRGLYGSNADLPEIPFDPEEAKRLLAEAGYPDGFDLTVSLKSSSTERELSLLRLAVSMWEDIGVRATIETIEESEFMRLRKSGGLACYTATWTADYNDPDNFIYTFFGSAENSAFRSLCYADEAVMERVRRARTITDEMERLAEYRELEKIIVQDDAAWIPLFSRLRYYVVSERLEGFRSAWNGSVKNEYRGFTIHGEA